MSESVGLKAYESLPSLAAFGPEQQHHSSCVFQVLQVLL